MLTIDHKRIGLMYAAVMFTFFFVAVIVALTMRLELFAPGQQYIDGDTFNQAFTLHGVYPGDPGYIWKHCYAYYDWCERCIFPKT
jgi:heme/copper-type cytochrome/quinol oxidase subunit 1